MGMSKKGDKKGNGSRKENGKAGKLGTSKLPASKAIVEMSKKDYDETLYRLQIELVKLQRHLIKSGEKIVAIFEGRDAAGKDGTIKRITEHLSPREMRVVALGKPSDRDRSSWYFQRYIQYLPAAQELVLFNRSWYNRAGVERVMGFCTNDEYEEFMNSVLEFEHMLIRAGLKLLKY
jgi:polyphosphate kinase 2 (PPK2 family)